MKLFRSFFIFIFILITVFRLLTYCHKTEIEDGIICQDDFKELKPSLNRIHQREWSLSTRSKTFCTEYNSDYRIVANEPESRKGLKKLKFDENIWSKVYDLLVHQNADKLDYLADSLYNISIENNLDEGQLAELIVTFVQDIPYSYVIPGNCSEMETEGYPCLGGIPYGIITPYEFMYSLYGDCDTRAVLIYVLLEHLGYTPMIVESDEYAHAMIAVNLSSTGDYIKYKGEKFYFWETTGKGWTLGLLPPAVKNVKYWKIALVHEL